jgi:hypothetical protein
MSEVIVVRDPPTKVIVSENKVTVIAAGTEGPPGPGLTSTDQVPEGLTNKYYTEGRVSANTEVAANSAARHTHVNKALLDTYDQINANLADAVAKKHTHANQATLDTTTANYTTAEKAKLAGVEAGAEVNTVFPSDLAAKEDTSDKSTASGLGTSDTLYPSQKAVKVYVDKVELSQSRSQSGVMLTF